MRRSARRFSSNEPFRNVSNTVYGTIRTTTYTEIQVSGPTPTAYAACTPNNVVGSANGGQGIYCQTCNGASDVVAT